MPEVRGKYNRFTQNTDSLRDLSFDIEITIQWLAKSAEIRRRTSSKSGAMGTLASIWTLSFARPPSRKQRRPKYIFPSVSTMLSHKRTTRCANSPCIRLTEL